MERTQQSTLAIINPFRPGKASAARRILVISLAGLLVVLSLSLTQIQAAPALASDAGFRMNSIHRQTGPDARPVKGMMAANPKGMEGMMSSNGMQGMMAECP